MAGSLSVRLSLYRIRLVLETVGSLPVHLSLHRMCLVHETVCSLPVHLSLHRMALVIETVDSLLVHLSLYRMCLAPETLGPLLVHLSMYQMCLISSGLDQMMARRCSERQWWMHLYWVPAALALPYLAKALYASSDRRSCSVLPLVLETLHLDLWAVRVPKDSEGPWLDSSIPVYCLGWCCCLSAPD